MVVYFTNYTGHKAFSCVIAMFLVPANFPPAPTPWSSLFFGSTPEGTKLTIVGDGTATRDYVYVSDVVEANIKAWQSAVGDGRAINIGSGKQISVNEIAKLVGGPTVNIPPRPGEMKFIAADASLAKQLLGWEPKVSFEEGIKMLKKEWGVE